MLPISVIICFLLPSKNVFSRPIYQTNNIDPLAIDSEDNSSSVVPKGNYKSYNVTLLLIEIFDSEDLRTPFCNGYLMDNKTILTAAHCFFNNNHKKSQTKFKFRVEGSDNYLDGRVYIHSEFFPEQYIKDIAIIFLDQTVASEVTQLTLPEPNIDTGKIEEMGYVYRPQKPSTVPMKILHKDECKSILKTRNKLYYSVICAVEIGIPNTIVLGNSGSAFLWDSGSSSDRLLNPIGILSYAEPKVLLDLRETTVFVFTNVSHYDSWLNRTSLTSIKLNSVVKRKKSEAISAKKDFLYEFKLFLLVLFSVIGSTAYVIYVSIVFYNISQRFSILEPFERKYSIRKSPFCISSKTLISELETIV